MLHIWQSTRRKSIMRLILLQHKIVAQFIQSALVTVKVPAASFSSTRQIGSSSDSVYFRVLGCGTSAGSRSLILCTSRKHYLFNCSENTNKLHFSHVRRAARIENIFITSKSWMNLSGVLGLALAIQSSANKCNVTLHAPKGCASVINLSKYFLSIANFSINEIAAEREERFEDEYVSIQPVTLVGRDPRKKPDPTIFGSWSLHVHPILSNHRAARVNHAPVSNTAFAYVVNVKATKDCSIDLEKCMALEVPPGPLLEELRTGNSITLPNGTVVTPAQVSLRTVPSAQKSYIIIECPSVEYLPSLTKDSRLKSEHGQLSDLATVFHFTPPDVIASESYSSWVNCFPPSVQHVFINERSAGIGTPSVIEHTRKLHLICPDLFPAMHDDVYYGLDRLPGDPYVNITRPMCQAYPGLNVVVHNITANESPGPSSPTTVTALEDTNAIEKALADAHLEMQAIRSRWPADKDDFPRVTFLGTGSSMPGKYRNVSSILVETIKDHFVMMDCGEGTLVQMHLAFGYRRMMHILSRLSAIYVSHMHCDHHMGFGELVLQRQLAFQNLKRPVKPLYVVAPGRFAPFYMNLHNNLEPILKHCIQITNEDLLLTMTGGGSSSCKKSGAIAELYKAAGLKDMATVRAIHCQASFCLSLTTRRNFKIVYTGDTRPSRQLIDLGLRHRRPDLLIHEATMEHACLKDCIKKTHSTFVEAIQDGLQMNSRFTILTHFSQRYSKVPSFDDFDDLACPNVGVVFDFMTVSPKTLALIQPMYPALKAVFADFLESLKLRTLTYRHSAKPGLTDAEPRPSRLTKLHHE